MFAGIGLWLAETTVGKWFTGSAAPLVARIPRGVWEALAVLGYALALFLTHQQALHAHDKAIIAANNVQWEHRLDAATAQVSKVDAQLAAASAQLKAWNDAENSRIAIAAHAIGVRGPGKAACASVPGASARPGGHAPASAPANAAGPGLPQSDGAAVSDPGAVPWWWLTNRAEEHDSMRAEVLSWRQWYADLVAKWPKLEQAKNK